MNVGLGLEQETQTSSSVDNDFSSPETTFFLFSRPDDDQQMQTAVMLCHEF